MPPENENHTPSVNPSPAPAGGLSDEAARLLAQATVLENRQDPAQAQLQQQNDQHAANVYAETKMVINAGLTPVFGIMAPNWNVTKGEVDQLAEAWAAVLLVYYPNGFADMGPWFGATLATAAVFGPRIGQPRKLPPPKQEGQGD
jgi:hypothetical protein